MSDTTCGALASAAETAVQNIEPSPDRLENGRFAPGNHVNPLGRPFGSRNKTTIIMKELMYCEGTAILGKLLAQARDGDLKAIKLCIERMLPPMKEPPVDIELPPITTLDDVVNAHTVLIAAASSGEIEPQQAKRMADLVELKRKGIESVELERRLQEVEAHVAKAKMAGFRPW